MNSRRTQRMVLAGLVCALSLHLYAGVISTYGMAERLPLTAAAVLLVTAGTTGVAFVYQATVLYGSTLAHVLNESDAGQSDGAPAQGGGAGRPKGPVRGRRS